MKRKRSIAAILLAGLMLSVTACGNGQAESTVTKADAEKAREEAEAEMKERHQERTQSSREAVSADDGGEEAGWDEDDASAGKKGQSGEDRENGVAAQQEETSDDGYVRGKVTDTTFESEWIGFRYELPDGFTMSDEDDMDAVLEAGGSMLYEDQADNIVDYAKLVMVYEMMAQDRYGNVITLFVEKTSFDIDTYVSAIKMQMGNVDAMDITMDDGETVEVGGVEFEKYSLTLGYGGMEIKEDYYLKKKDGRMICMLTGYSSDEAAEAIMSGFSPY